MCGLVAVFGNIIKKHEDAFADMLIVDQVRGQHSTGMFRVSRHQDEVNVAKVVGTPDVLIDSKAYTKALSGFHRVLVGHNRWATKGAITRNNAHPFEFDNVVGVHNGSLKTYHKLDGHNDFPVDSQVLYNHIDRKGLKDMVNNCDGAMALIWWNKTTSELNIFRNTDRPLYFATTKDGVVMLGSEAGMLDWIADRNHIELETLEPVAANHHVRFKLDKGTTVIPKPIVEKVEKAATVSYLPFRQPGAANTNAANASVQQQSANKPKEDAVGFAELATMKTTRDLFEVTGSGRLHNQTGMMLTNITYPKLKFFLVDTPATSEFRKGDMVETVCSGFAFNRDDGTYYYFLQQPGMQHIPCYVDVQTDVVEEEEEETIFHQTLLNPNGKAIPAKEWYRLYGHCAYCQSDLEPETATAIRDKSGYLCTECVDDASVVLNLC